MSDLTGVAKTIFDEVMDEISEEIHDSLDGLIVTEKLDEIINTVQASTTANITQAINKYYSDQMNSVRKLILGEIMARTVSAEVKTQLQGLVSEILGKSFSLVDELRNEIIGEVFEETEIENKEDD
ncbi:MAG: hypothetical protein OEY49_03735 [Candidatus Heimdallarchaeota archaeon]|nr:hypothetical protein [Candidatus Heimdallarchaeota archaeon]